MFEGVNSFFGRLGGLLGFGPSPSSIMSEANAARQAQLQPEAVNVMGAEYQGAEANPGNTFFPEQRRDPFARFTPEQRRQLGLGYLADAAMQFGGRQGTAANALMNAFDTSAGRTPTRPAAAQQEPQMQFAPLQQMPPVTMPPMRPMAINIPRRTALQVPSLLGV